MSRKHLEGYVILLSWKMSNKWRKIHLRLLVIVHIWKEWFTQKKKKKKTNHHYHIITYSHTCSSLDYYFLPWETKSESHYMQLQW